MKGRENKDGVLEGDELKETAEKINHFIDEKKEGGPEYEVDGGILSQALGSKEHSGRMRGIGGVITPSSSVLHLSNKRSNYHLCKQYEMELEAQKNKSLEQEERIRRLEELVFKSEGFKVESEELGSCSVKVQRSIHDESQLDHTPHPVKLGGDDDDLKIVEEKTMGLDNDDRLKGKSVALSLESRTDVVAYGTIINIYDATELPKNCMRVAIDVAVDEKANLPIPKGDRLHIKDAVGSHVAWPMNLIKLHVQNARKNKKKVEVKMSSLDFSSVPAQLHMLYCYSKLQKTTSGVISIPLENDVFGHERMLYVNFEDIEPFCRLDPITYTCIAVYIWHLHRELNKDNLRFVDPYGIGYMPTDRKDREFYDDQIDLRARSLANRLVVTSDDQLVLAPCNVSDHWILTVIDPHKMEVYLFDSLFSSIRDKAWKLVVEAALTMFNAAMEKKGKVKWNVLKVPKQPDAKQCGFYVLRYMRQIVKFEGKLNINSLQSLFVEKSYTKAEIDEVRAEWATCVQSAIIE